jgi:hypothetical protein
LQNPEERPTADEILKEINAIESKKMEKDKDGKLWENEKLRNKTKIDLIEKEIRKEKELLSPRRGFLNYFFLYYFLMCF